MTDPRITSVSLRTLALVVGALLAMFVGWSFREPIGAWFSRPAQIVAPVTPVINVPAPVVNVEAKVALPPATMFKANEDYDFYLGDKRLDGAEVFSNGWLKWREGQSEGRLMHDPVDLRWKKRSGKSE